MKILSPRSHFGSVVFTTFVPMRFIYRHKLIVIGLFIGTLGGYIYYQLVGCTSGTCPITSRPLNSTLYGAIMGALLFSIFDKSSK